MKNIKIINKNKFIRTIIILAILIGAIISVFNNRAYSNTEEKYKTEYVVKEKHYGGSRKKKYKRILILKMKIFKMLY